jgi:hypothetical protein
VPGTRGAGEQGFAAAASNGKLARSRIHKPLLAAEFGLVLRSVQERMTLIVPRPLQIHGYRLIKTSHATATDVTKNGLGVDES